MTIPEAPLAACQLGLPSVRGGSRRGFGEGHVALAHGLVLLVDKDDDVLEELLWELVQPSGRLCWRRAGHGEEVEAVELMRRREGARK